MDIKKTKSLVEASWSESIFKTLEEYIRIPNQSPAYDPEWETNGHLDKAVNLLVDWVKSQKVPDLSIQVLKEPKRTPLIYMSVPATKDCKTDETILMYGHLDKQPPLADEWEKGLHPYTPVLRDGKLYGRGSADDGYATFAAVTALKALKEQGASHPKISIVIESCEESDSLDLIYFMKKLYSEMGKVGLIICLDSGAGNYEQFWLTTSLRGIASGILKVKILTEGVHSGASSGVVPSSFRIVRTILDRVEDPKTGKILLPELYVDVSEKRQLQAKQAAETLGNVIWSEFPFVEGAKPIHHDNTELLLNKTWRPQLSVTGASGFPHVSSAGNVLRSESQFTLSMRLPPTCNAHKATEALKHALEKEAPYGSHVTFQADEPASGWESPILADWLEKSINEHSNNFFGKPAVQLGEGGSIPFMGLLGEEFPQAQFVITGVLGPKSNAHGPNEFLHVEMFKNVTSCVAHILYDFFKVKSH